MPPFRIPFTSKKPLVHSGVETLNDENARPTPNGAEVSSPYKDKPSLALGIKERKEEPNEFKLSSVDGTGQYLPPSPVEKKSFWHKSPTAAATNHRSIFNEHEPFSISRESFESYRRSFDISGRSPILQADSYTSRTSLDSRTSRTLPRSAMNSNTFERPSSTEEEGFEDVTLSDEATRHQPKKKSFLSRFGDSSNEPGSEEKKEHRFHLPGRKRGQSGTGSELAEVTKRPASKGKNEVLVQ